MDSNTWNLIKIARKVARENPILGYELEKEARQHAAVINPGAESFDKKIESMVTVLKSLKQELEGAMKKLSEDPDAAEFAKFFDDEASAEEEELRQLLKKSASSRQAGPKDWLKKLFKKKDKGEKAPKEEKAPKDEDAGMQPSYQMDESTMDEFVEGKRDWADPGHYIEEENKEHKEFFGGAENVLKEMDSIRKKPSKNAIQALLKTIDKLIRHGGNLMKGMRKHLMEPAPKIDLSEEEPKKPAEKGKMKPEELSMTVTNYGQSLLDAAGDEKKTISLLKELFDTVGPMIKENRAEFAAVRSKLLPILVKVAHSTPRTRPVLLPAIRRMAAAR